MRVHMQLELDVDEADYLRLYAQWADPDNLEDTIVDHVVECVALGGNGSWTLTRATVLHGFKPAGQGLQVRGDGQ